MTRFTISAVAVAVALAAAAPAIAAQSPTQTSAPKQTAKVERVVMQCDTDAATRRAFMREHGAAPVFVTADEALAARASGQTWATPRCMTAREHGRLSQALTSYAAVR